jgi:phosphoribosylamine-glycine ligase
MLQGPRQRISTHEHSAVNILLLGSGGREHALAWKMAASPLADRLFCVPGMPASRAKPRASTSTSPIMRR